MMNYLQLFWKALLFIFFMSNWAAAQTSNNQYVPHQILVKFKKSTNVQQKNSLKSSLQAESLKSIEGLNIELWQLPVDGSWTVETALTHFQQEPTIEFISPNLILSLAQNTNHSPVESPLFDQQWALHNTGQSGGLEDADIDALEAMDIRTESPDVVVGIIDSGIDWTHPDLVDNIWQNLGEDFDGDGRVIEWDANQERWVFDPDDENGEDDDGNNLADDFIGWNFIDDNNNPFDEIGHGTHVAGIIGANGANDFGINGVTWNVQLAALKIFGTHQHSGELFDVYDAIYYANAHGFPITNNSYGTGRYDAMLEAVIGESPQLFVASAGNEGMSTDLRPRYPAAFDAPNIISVAATNHNDNLSSFSSYHPTDVDLAAPGKHIYSTLPNNRYGFKSGTSMAAAFVSGAAALLLAECEDSTVPILKTKLIESADVKPNLQGKCAANGRLNVANALQFEAVSFFLSEVVEDNLAVSFSPIDTELEFEWDFGDGTTLTAVGDVNHTFPRHGSYKVCVNSTQPCGTFESCERIVVTTPNTCDALYEVIDDESNNDNICFGDNHHIALVHNTPDFLSFEWFVGEHFESGVIEAPTTGIIYPQAFPRPGDYKATLVVYRTLDTCMADFYQPIYPASNHVNLGEDSRICAGSTIIQTTPEHENSFMYQYDWFDNNDALPIASGYELFVNTSGRYIIENTDMCNTTTRDTIDVLLQTCDSWPGDTDFNGIVNTKDVLRLFCKDGQLGPARSESAITWQAQEGDDWNDEEFLTDGKHADCDGDGMIDLPSDLQAIIENYNKNHQEGSYFPIENQQGNFKLQPELMDYTVDEDSTTFTLGLKFENQQAGSVDVMGMAFSIDYRGFGSRAHLNVGQSILGASEDLTVFTRPALGTRLDVVLLRSNKTTTTVNFPNTGEVAHFFIVDQNIVTDDPTEILQTTHLKINNVQIITDPCTFLNNVGGGAISMTALQENTSNRNNEANLVIAIESFPSSCSVGGHASIEVMGGVPPYELLWDSEKTTLTTTELFPRVHQVTVTDAAQNQITGLVEITGTPPIKTTIQTTSNGDNTYTAIATSSGGVGNHTYLWSDGQVGATAYNLPEGQHYVEVRDVNYCSITQDFQIGSPLSVDLLNFQAQITPSQTVQLQWKTINERDLDHYDILRSNDGIHFQKLDHQTARNLTQTVINYDYLDKNVQPGKWYYYQIEIHHLDGKTERSSIEAVQIPTTTTADVLLYPTLVKDQFQIVFPHAIPQKIPIRIHDATGRLIRQIDLSPNSDNPIFKIDFEKENSGFYYVSLEYNNVLKSFKIVKW